MGGHGRGKKRARYEKVNGHLFVVARRQTGSGKRFGGLAEKSLCGLTVAQAGAQDDDQECRSCHIAKEQTWS